MFRFQLLIAVPTLLILAACSGGGGGSECQRACQHFYNDCHVGAVGTTEAQCEASCGQDAGCLDAAALYACEDNLSCASLSGLGGLAAIASCLSEGKCPGTTAAGPTTGSSSSTGGGTSGGSTTSGGSAVSATGGSGGGTSGGTAAQYCASCVSDADCGSGAFCINDGDDQYFCGTDCSPGANPAQRGPAAKPWKTCSAHAARRNAEMCSPKSGLCPLRRRWHHLLRLCLGRRVDASASPAALGRPAPRFPRWDLSARAAAKRVADVRPTAIAARVSSATAACAGRHAELRRQRRDLRRQPDDRLL